MPNIKLVISSFLMLFALSVTAVQAAKPDGNAGSQNQQSESFWERWIGRSERVDSRDDDDDRLENKQKHKEKSKKQTDRAHAYFSDSERTRIADYYRQDSQGKSHKKNKKAKKKNLPYGLQKKLDRGGQLPPGWQTKVARGEVLDGEILRHSELIPDELARRLPALRDGEEIRRVGDRVVRVLEGNGTVIDVIDLADIFMR